MDTTLRLYAIIREDLQMTPGKMASQAGHAFLNAYLKSLNVNPEWAAKYQENGIGTKITLGAKNLNQFNKIKDELDKTHVPFDYVIDSGHVMPPYFDGNPIPTAIGIGPCYRHEIEHITRKLKLIG